MHIPAPDPLANPDAVARAGYYDIRSTPSTVFNGRPLARGGTSHAGKKYNQYRRVIERLLRGPKDASIALEARRVGEEVHIRTSGEILKGSANGRPLLRLALVENEVTYGGGNGVRTHRRVVRALPGGPEGYTMEGGRWEVECVVRLDQVRASLESYLAEYPKSAVSRGDFSKALPPIELRRLSVVAFIQNDADKEVLHVVEVTLDAELGDTRR